MALYPNTNMTGHRQIQRDIYFVQSISKYLQRPALRQALKDMYFLFSRSLNPWEINVQINSKILP